MLGVVGEGGAGKSILVRSLVNLVPHPGRIVRGRVNVFGQDLLKMSESELRMCREARIGVVIQNGRIYLNPLVRVGDQTVNVYRPHNRARRSEVVPKGIEMLRDVGIPAPAERFRQSHHGLAGWQDTRGVTGRSRICSPESS